MDNTMAMHGSGDEMGRSATMAGYDAWLAAALRETERRVRQAAAPLVAPRRGVAESAPEDRAVASRLAARLDAARGGDRPAAEEVRDA
jgi:hypothetical protein